MAVRQSARRQRVDLKAAAVLAEMRYTPEAGMVARRYEDPATGEVFVRTGPSSRLKCMRVRYAPTVAFVRFGGPGSSVTTTGLTRCGNVWACPACMYSMLREKGEELKSAVDAWHAASFNQLTGEVRRRVFLVTLTARHHAWTDEPALRDAVQESWREVWQGKEAQAFKDATGIAWWFRRLEVNYGKNGAHPHQHAVVAFDDAKDEEQQSAILRWFLWRWASALAKRGFTCDAEHGANIVDCDRAGEYLVKMGLGLVLELTASDQKEAAEGSRTPLKVLHDFSELGRDEDGRLWQQHVTTWAGRRMLERSRGRLAPPKPSDSALPLPKTAPAVVGTMSATDFDAIPMHDRFRERLTQQELHEASEWQQTYADWVAQQCYRLGLEAPAGLSDDVLDPRPRRELRASHVWQKPDEASWVPPKWWDAFTRGEAAERLEAEGLDWS